MIGIVSIGQEKGVKMIKLDNTFLIFLVSTFVGRLFQCSYFRRRDNYFLTFEMKNNFTNNPKMMIDFHDTVLLWVM
jgi:hypothetical protein